MECNTIENGNVILVEPNCININNGIDNGIPQYQDMYIFAELTARSKGRTVIIDNNASSTTSKKINFLGNNQDNETGDNPNYLNFTTNYYDGSTGNRTHYEGFGINNIKIVINSSFIPQVNIQFVDIRGLAFFNQVDSPYRILFDFPPPIFTLTVKGYYGKPLTYELHLVKYTSEFSAANGNFIIDAQFVAMTFAPLTDILFRYAVNAPLISLTNNEDSTNPLINKKDSMNPDPGVKPTNTYELVLKLEKLYAAIAKMLETDVDNNSFKNTRTDIEKIDLIFDILNGYKENEALKPAGTPQLVIRTPDPNDSLLIFPLTNSVPQDKLLPIKNIVEYNEVIKSNSSSGTGNRIKNRLYMVYVVATNVEQEDNTEPSNLFQVQTYPFENNTENNSQFEKPLLKFKDQLLSGNITSILLENTDITEPESFLNSYNIQSATRNPTGYTKYYGIDISGFYNKLYYKKSELELQKTTLSENITRKINAMVKSRLGMIPSIYNVFKIILDDVDQLFYQIKSTSNLAYDKHNKPISVKKIILGEDSYKEQKGDDTEVFAFPLIINTVSNNRQERVAPIELSTKVPFPEIDLVNNFINTFLDQNNFAKQLNTRENQADDGTYKWIPISPFDSKLGGATPESPYLGVSDNVRTETLKIMLKRFYMLTQGTISEAFYSDEDGGKKKVKKNYVRSSAYLNLYSKAEAINLETILTTKTTADNLKIMADKYSANILDFYTDISGITDTYYTDSGEVTGSLYNFPQYDPKYFLISPSSPNTGRVYVDKTNPNFNGLKITNEKITIQNLSANSDNPVDNFKGETEINGFWGQDVSVAENYFDFTEQNLLYLRDKTLDGEVNTVDFGGKITTYSRYLSRTQYYYDLLIISGARFENSTDHDNVYPGNNRQTDIQRQEIAYEQGNASFKEKVSAEERQLNYGADIIDIWSSQLGKFDDQIIDTITGLSTQKLSSMIILSNFGFSISPFNKFPGLLNSLVFDTPSAIEVPAYYAPYVGALITAVEEGWITGTTNNNVMGFFTISGGSYLSNRGFFVLADAHDVNQYLSENDKEKFRVAYQTYMGITHGGVVDGINDMYKVVRGNGTSSIYGDGWRTIVYSYLLNLNAKLSGDIKIDYGNKGMFFNVVSDLIVRETIINYSQITFMMSDLIPPYPSGYTSIKMLNDTGKENGVKDSNDNYFIKLFLGLSALIIKTNKKLKEEEEEQKKISGDENIINQLYYSFKNINDKWLTGTAKSDSHYPFNKKDKKLINSFAFVDRGMNPIGETILNCEILSEMLKDPNISIFSVLTQLLSINGFEFFPLQNFLSFETETSWEDGFKIHTGGYDDQTNPYFVCMYIGGASSYPSVSGNGFENDGVIDISKPGVPDYSTSKPKKEEINKLKARDVDSLSENEKQILNEDFPWQQVRAFRVRFGEQNQSMFTDIKIDSKEYPETNESIQILSRLAGDQNPNAPVPIGQSLYNLYENRSYKATVTGFGNAMIQPTQYFQLENIPLFDGAYIILNVEHNITANKMTTSFSGTKLLKYPAPRVLTPIAVTGYDGLSGAEASVMAQNAAPEATMMTPERVGNKKDNGGLDGVLGVDVSHHNGNADWKKAKAGGVEFAFIKLTQGDTFYSGNQSGYNINKQITDAINNDVLVGYYHFVEWGNTVSPVADGVTQANNFINRLETLPKSKFPPVLDVEGGYAWTSARDKTYMWSNKTTDLTKMIQSFIDTMKLNGYETMIYSRKGFLSEHQISGFEKQALWQPQFYWLSGNLNPERDEPSPPNDWFDWDIWQFSSQGIVDGIPPAGQEGALGVDLNVMRKRFLEKYT